MASRRPRKKKHPRGIYSSTFVSKNTSLFTPPAHGEWIGNGDPYIKNKKPNPKLKGTQFQVGKPAKDYFSPLQPLTIVPNTGSAYKSDPYDTGPAKPNNKQLSQDAGFGSKNGRGIQNSVRASRMYAEKLHMESNALRKASPWKSAAQTILDTSAAAALDAEITLFDRCNAGEEDDSLRLKPGVGAKKRIGSMSTTANIYGANANES